MLLGRILIVVGAESSTSNKSSFRDNDAERDDAVDEDQLVESELRRLTALRCVGSGFERTNGDEAPLIRTRKRTSLKIEGIVPNKRARFEQEVDDASALEDVDGNTPKGKAGANEQDDSDDNTVGHALDVEKKVGDKDIANDDDE